MESESLIHNENNGNIKQVTSSKEPLDRNNEQWPSFSETLSSSNQADIELNEGENLEESRKKKKAKEEIKADNNTENGEQKELIGRGKKEEEEVVNKQSELRNKSKITHRSQSSPSSLTTHKFGLRPTPSPPRLIIDHQTGDIVESYPAEQVYLRTYQPLDDDITTVEDSILDDSLTHPYPPPLNSEQQLEQYHQLLAQQYQSQQQQHLQDPHCEAYNSSEEFVNPMNNQQNNSSFRPAIPPPHSGRVYFPEQPPINAGHLFHHNQQQQQRQMQQQPLINSLGYHQLQAAQQVGADPLVDGQLEEHRISGSHNQSFKRALNKLNESVKTDIALVTEAEERVNQRLSSGNVAGARMKVTATSAAKANALLAQNQLKQQHQQLQLQQVKQQQMQGKPFQGQHPDGNGRVVLALEDFDLYNFCYNFRVLLVFLLSSLIIYLLVVPLNLTCTIYRPTYTYISIIVSSVNLICIIVFTLFWYCNGVTRTLYANLSSSAFIITIYSILVAVNLALAILFFFINTCHFEKIINTKSTTLIISPTSSLAAPHYQLASSNEGGPNQMMLLSNSLLLDPTSYRYSAIETLDDHDWSAANGVERGKLDSILRSTLSSHSKDSEELSEKKVAEERLIKLLGLNQEAEEMLRSRRSLMEVEEDDLTSGFKHDHSLIGGGAHLQQAGAMQRFAISPIEAAWEFLKDQLVLLKRKFNQFLLNYDLKFIGTLHALCAMCFQYLAMKVAVVRSYFCSPVNSYM